MIINEIILIDGERIQIHKRGNSEYKYYSRNLKPVLSWKTKEIEEWIPKAITISDIILDGEILLMDTKTHQPLPFGSLNIHKKNNFTDATVCVFLFDILYINGKSLLSLPLHERRQILEDNVTIIPNRVELTELHKCSQTEEISSLMTNAIRNKQEGLVIKDKNGIYEPNIRRWLKFKRDYMEGSADSADLFVLGGYYSEGKHKGLIAVFLMGCYDPSSDTYKTVTKVSGGINDETLELLQTELDMITINSYDDVPKWLNIHKTLLPNKIIRNPNNAPIWEIAGNAFEKGSKIHTSGISIRFPRIVKFRDDKSWDDATSLDELLSLTSQSLSDFTMISSHKRSHSFLPEPSDISSTKRKRKKTSSSMKSEKRIDNNTDPHALPNIFTNLYILLYKVKDEQYFMRHIVAYDGEIYDTNDNISKCTHIVTDGIWDSMIDALFQSNKRIKVVNTDWVRYCIKHKQKIHERVFFISKPT